MKFLSVNHKKQFLTAREAQNILKYGFRNITITEAFSKEVDYLESSIKSKSLEGFRILASPYPNYKEDLVEELVGHFREKGFTVDIYKNPNIDGFLVLIIGW